MNVSAFSHPTLLEGAAKKKRRSPGGSGAPRPGARRRACGRRSARASATTPRRSTWSTCSVPSAVRAGCREGQMAEQSRSLRFSLQARARKRKKTHRCEKTCIRFFLLARLAWQRRRTCRGLAAPGSERGPRLRDELNKCAARPAYDSVDTVGSFRLSGCRSRGRE